MKTAAILLLLAFSLAACSSEEAELTQPENENASEEDEEADAVPSQNQNLPEAEETNRTQSQEENRRDQRNEEEGPGEDEEPEPTPPENQNTTQDARQTNLTQTQNQNATQEDEETSEEIIKEVTLTPAERGDLKAPTVTEEVLERLGMTEYPGYSDDYDFHTGTAMTGFRKRLPLESLYVAGYGYNEDVNVIILTMVFSPDNIKNDSRIIYDLLDCNWVGCDQAFLEEIAQSPIELESSKYRFLRKGRTVVFIRGDDKIDSAWIEDTANKISQRIGIKFVDFQKVLHQIKLKRCNFSKKFECKDYFLHDESTEVILKSKIGEEVKIEEIFATSDSFIGGKCTTGQIDKLMAAGEEYRFELNLGETGSMGCEYNESAETNGHFLGYPNHYVYSVKIRYIYVDNPRLRLAYIDRGTILKKKPSGSNN